MKTITLVLLLIVGLASAQPHPGYERISGKDFEELLNKAFPSHEKLARGQRLVVTVRILVPFGIESQLVIICNYSGECSLGRTVLSSSLSKMVTEAISRGEAHDSIMSIPVESETQMNDVDSEIAQVLIVDLWKALKVHAERAEIESKDITSNMKEIAVALDATSYQISVSQGQTSADVYFPGPDPAGVSAGVKLSPLVRWSVNLREVVLRQLRGVPEKRKP